MQAFVLSIIPMLQQLRLIGLDIFQPFIVDFGKPMQNETRDQSAVSGQTALCRGGFERCPTMESYLPSSSGVFQSYSVLRTEIS